MTVIAFGQSVTVQDSPVEEPDPSPHAAETVVQMIQQAGVSYSKVAVAAAVAGSVSCGTHRAAHSAQVLTKPPCASPSFSTVMFITGVSPTPQNSQWPGACSEPPGPSRKLTPCLLSGQALPPASSLSTEAGGQAGEHSFLQLCCEQDAPTAGKAEAPGYEQPQFRKGAD